MMTYLRPEKGFTLIELLVVIAIIGLLASVIVAALNGARSKAKDARRVADFHDIQQAIELYGSANNAYPSTGFVANPVPPGGGTGWRSQCSMDGGYASANVAPGLVPGFMSSFPADPDMNTVANTCCYEYASDGTEYKLIEHNCPTANFASQPSLSDSNRDAGSNLCLVETAGNTWCWAIYSKGACAW